MQYENYQEAVENVDWKLLQQQKKAFEELILALPLCAKLPNIPHNNLGELRGLIELIEILQDVHENEPNTVVHFEKMK